MNTPPSPRPKTNRLLIGACLAASAVGQSQLNAALVNGSFETGNLSGWSALGNVSVSSGLNYGVAGIVMPDSGSFAARLNTAGVSAGTLASTMGITEATLEATNPGVNATNGSLIYQTVSAVAGDKFQFRWNFVEQDYVPYDDWAFYGVKFNSDPTVPAKFASLATVGPGNGSTINGWETLTVDINATGNYTFYFGIVNGRDFALDSDLWVDGVVVGQVSAIPEPGSMVGLGLLMGSGLLVRSRRRKA